MSLMIRENVPLAPLTTLKVGGPARLFARAESESDVADAVALAAERELALFVLGGGSNVVIADHGFDGLVLHIALRGVAAEHRNGEAVVEARAGEDWDEFVRFCVERDLAGVECLSGIPGSVGAVPVQNVGAYGQEVADTLIRVRAFDRRARRFVELSRDECGFGYRSSIFNGAERNRFIITAVAFRLRVGGAPTLTYQDLRARFGDGRPSLAEVRRAVLDVRRAKGMVIDPTDPDTRSVGSFFKNPVLTRAEFARLERRCATLGLASVPHFDAGNERVKVPAAWLIERAGFAKGHCRGGACISTKHSLAIVNRSGQATAAEIIALKDEIQQRVAALFAIELVPEPVLVGFGAGV